MAGRCERLCYCRGGGGWVRMFAGKRQCTRRGRGEQRCAGVGVGGWGPGVPVRCTFWMEALRLMRINHIPSPPCPSHPPRLPR